MDSAEAWLVEHDPEYAETSKAWKHVIGGTYEMPWEERWENPENKTVEDLLEAGARAVQGVPTRACMMCGTAFEAERRDGNHQRFCTEKCRKRAENRRLRMRGSIHDV